MSILANITLILLAGIGAQWLAWRIRVPSILLLLLAGMLLGPLSVLIPGVDVPALNTGALFGDALVPLVSLSVALILYEGGLTLDVREIAESRRSVFMLVTLGAAVTLVLAGLLARFLLGLPWELAALLGAILTVTGPTVVGPLLRHVRPKGKVGAILKWEGIVIDPIGAMLAVLVFEAILAIDAGDSTHVAFGIAEGIFKTVVIGGGLGVVCAWILTEMIRRYWLPDSLQNPFSLMLVALAFVTADYVQHDAGLFATTAMGVALANQRRVRIHHILEFKENLRVLLISALFIVLAANLELEELKKIGIAEVIFVAVLILIIRPASVFAATATEKMTKPERLFLSWMAPRGIVAAAVASVFALRLAKGESSDPLAELTPVQEAAASLVPITFTVIIGTVLVYGLSAGRVARRLGVADQDPQGVLIIGAHKWARELGRMLHSKNISVILVDTNRMNLREARMSGLRVKHANVLEEGTAEELELTGVGRVLALTPNDEVNALALQQFVGRFERAELYRLPMSAEEAEITAHEGRPLFAKGLSYAKVASRFGSGHILKATRLSEEFPYEAYLVLYGAAAIPMFTLSPDGRMQVLTADKPAQPGPGDTVIALVDPEALFMGGPLIGDPPYSGDADEPQFR